MNFRLILLAALVSPAFSVAAELPIVSGVDAQPLAAQVRRLADALELNGAPLSADEKAALAAAANLSDADAASAKIQAVLDPHCLVAVNINPGNASESRSRPGESRI